MDYIKIAKRVIEIEKEALSGIQDIFDDNFNKATELLLKTKGKVVVTGMGKSGLIGRKIAASFSSTGTPSFFLHPSEALHGDLGMIDKNDSVLAIANSGETPEILKLLPYTKEHNIPVIAITSKPKSSLARQATIPLCIGQFEEACPLNLAPTTSSTLTLVMGDALMVALMEGRNFNADNFSKFHPAGNLGKRLSNKVKNYMTEEKLPLITPTAKMSEVIFIINQGRAGIGIVGTPDKVLGVITDGDLRRAINEYQEKFFSLTPEDIMTSSPKYIKSDEKATYAKNLMHSNQITVLLVGNPSKLEGIIELHKIDLALPKTSD